MPFPFHGNSIILRPFEPEDLLALQGYLNHPDLMGRRYLPSGFSEIVPLARKQVEEIYAKVTGIEEGVNLAVTLTESGKLVGHAGADWGWDRHCPDLYLVIAPDHQRQGLGTEVIDLLLRYVFENTPAHVVTGWVADWNTAGWQFLLKRGFQTAGRSRRVGIYQGRYFDLVVADLLRQEWMQRAKGTGHAS
jgi:RimJ/RimL family protein N-acetyltransferase